MEFTKLIKGTTSAGQNVGLQDIKLLSVSGNAIASQQFEYIRPTQEVFLYKGTNIQLSIVDPIIKDEV